MKERARSRIPVIIPANNRGDECFVISQVARLVAIKPPDTENIVKQIPYPKHSDLLSLPSIIVKQIPYPIRTK